MPLESVFTPACLICGNAMDRVALSELLKDGRQQGIYEAQAQRLQYSADHVWRCGHCNIIHPFEFFGKQEAHRPIVDEADEANCPGCGFDLVRLGGCEQFNAFQKIYYCPFCIASAKAVAIFGYTKPDNSAHFYFTRLNQNDVLARLDYVENEDLLFTVRPGSVSPGQVHNALTRYRDMFREDPEQAFHVMSREDMKAVRFIFAYAHDFKPVEAGKEQTREALSKHQYVSVECPCPEHFRRLKLGPEETVLECRSGHRNQLLYAALALCALGGSIASGVPELIGLGVLLSIGAFTYIGCKITAYTQLIVEKGEIRIEQKAIIPSISNVRLRRITGISLAGYHKALGAGRVKELSPDIVDSGAASATPVPLGLLLINGEQKTFVPVMGTYAQLLWMRRVVLEAASAQGICRT